MQLCWLREEGYRLEPDMIIYAHYGEPPLYHKECLADLACPVVEDGFVYSEEPSLKKRIMNTAKKSGIVFYTWYFYQRFLLGGEADDAQGLGLELYGDVRAQLAEEDVDRIADGYEEYVRNVRAYVRRPVPVAFLFIPFSFVVHPEDSARFQHRELRGPAEVARERALMEELGAELDPRGVTFVDTTPPLREGRERARMYYWLDIHLTPAGNRVVAEAVVPPLQELISRVATASESCGDAGGCTASSARPPTSSGLNARGQNPAANPSSSGGPPG
jgi:SGNH hydrolase-like domain, acetyltransferase AlgX